MDVSRIGGQNHFVTNSIRANKSGVERLLGVKTTKMPLAREPIEDNFSSRGKQQLRLLNYHSMKEQKLYYNQM